MKANQLLAMQSADRAPSPASEALQILSRDSESLDDIGSSQESYLRTTSKTHLLQAVGSDIDGYLSDSQGNEAMLVDYLQQMCDLSHCSSDDAAVLLAEGGDEWGTTTPDDGDELHDGCLLSESRLDAPAYSCPQSPEALRRLCSFTESLLRERPVLELSNMLQKLLVSSISSLAAQAQAPPAPQAKVLKQPGTRKARVQQQNDAPPTRHVYRSRRFRPSKAVHGIPLFSISVTKQTLDRLMQAHHPGQKTCTLLSLRASTWNAHTRTPTVQSLCEPYSCTTIDVQSDNPTGEITLKVRGPRKDDVMQVFSKLRMQCVDSPRIVSINDWRDGKGRRIEMDLRTDYQLSTLQHEARNLQLNRAVQSWRSKSSIFQLRRALPKDDAGRLALYGPEGLLINAARHEVMASFGHPGKLAIVIECNAPVRCFVALVP
jgi:hypothetical protein